MSATVQAIGLGAGHGERELFSGLDFDERVTLVAREFGLAVDLPMTALSGGQAARAYLAALLLSQFDAYLLDEPTNDLDSEGLDLLEDFVDGLDAPVVVVSHDREFLTRTVTTVVEIDRSLLRITTFGGGYDAYLDERSTARRQARQTERQIERLDVPDEPTNHLDLPAIEQLEEALESFDGTVLLVRHDRRMLDTVRLTRCWHVEDGVVTEVPAPSAE